MSLPVSRQSSEDRDLTNIAAHSWDVRAAKESGGLQTAYCTVYELDPCVAIFGEYDIIEHDLVAMANAIVAKYGSKK
jgi:hypothetical protein